MKNRLWGLEIPLGGSSDEEALRRLAARGLGIRIEALSVLRVVRKSLDARRGRRVPAWVFTVDLEMRDRPTRIAGGLRLGPIPDPPTASAAPSRTLGGVRAVVVGTGPSGLFAAEAFALRGASVTVLEQGPPLEGRVSAVAGLWRAGELHPDANVQFGEGGAGTFSDGKLTTRIKDPLSREVLRRFARAGAPESILEEAHPHLGTDGVRRVVRSMRGQIEGLGACFHFRRPLLDLSPQGRGWRLSTPDGPLDADVVVLAVGHSSRDLARRLVALGVPFRAKGFAVGVRAEHPQNWVDGRQYGKFAGHPDLAPAEYFLTFSDEETGRGVYSFCMCPGGLVVNSASEEGHLVTNGMSMSHRASGFANAGIVVTVRPEDFGADPLNGLSFQEDMEARGYALGGGGYKAPAQSAAAFLENRTDPHPLRTSFRPGTRNVNLRGFFPDWVEGPLVRALARFDRTMPGFVERGVLLAPETRTSSPMQVLRSESGEPPGFPGLLLVGEGAGWSGGIVSSAVDALRVVEAWARSR
ncbi:MAG: NAD(P)/FAD-dependent oxidoreductase [Acidobacteriota bacterium]